ncbi:alpha/beta-hydrolase [Hypoxylon trugodes]|uniref:alpha/beta-hydrolase n=1 Tax=Hypoxylon trugodes TaxID=326681 RepID=UPI002194617F|nr:alpha/beta-hydrolase [Hypoxylon trugodes]KAI1393824.1 alpha/beta-hydrolase [Hypoxylon trugodes]
MLLQLALAAFVVGAKAVPSPQTLDSSLTLLIDNDLQGVDGSASKSGVLLLEARSLDAACKACKAVGEDLWSPESGIENIKKNLDYLKYVDSGSDDSRFWIASNNGSAQAIDLDGNTSRARPDVELPVLCTQSAPFSNETSQDASEKWQVTVKSNNEVLTGYRDHLSFRFLGIRYAPQPKRFTYSEPYVGNGGNVSALKYNSECVQAGNVGAEDCLFLNVWTTYIPGPESAANKLKPVMFWIHGGAFINGSPNDPTFDGGNLATRGDVIVVTVTYRLSTLGFLALDDGVTNGNYGIADQINALDWVRKNIKDFGGDPDRITIFGQSAGAGSVRALLASPKAAGKFAGAIQMSNVGGTKYDMTYSKYYTIAEEMEVAGNAILKDAGCANATSKLDCLQDVSPQTLVGLSDTARWPVVDGTYLISDALQLDGPTLPVRIMMGITRNDGGPFISFPTTTNETEYLISQGFDVPPADLFPVADIENKTLALFEMGTRLVTDGVFRCDAHATAYAGLQNGRFNPVYLYEFNRTYQLSAWPGIDLCQPPKSAGHPDGDPNAEYLKCHSGELYYVFGNLARQNLPLRDEFDLPFERLIVDSFSSFARSFNPNPDPEFLEARGYTSTLEEIESSGEWLPSTVEGDMTMRTLQWPSIQGPFTETEQCEGLGLGLGYYLS